MSMSMVRAGHSFLRRFKQILAACEREGYFLYLHFEWNTINVEER